MISIDKDTCIKCKACVKICPVSIFFADGNGDIALRYEDSCIKCGHCVGVCPTGSVVHSSFPASKVHEIDKGALPTPEQLMLLIKSRRSNRAMSKKPVPEDALRMILEAAHRAPTAENKQFIDFTVVSGEDKIRSISQFTIDAFTRVQNMLANPLVKPLLKPFMRSVFRMIPLFERLKTEFSNGNDGIMRKATTVIFITSAGTRYAAADANLAYQNASLMAESLGVAQFYMGFVMAAEKLGKGKLEKMFGIKGRIYAAIALGMPEVKFKNYIDRKDINVTFK